MLDNTKTVLNVVLGYPLAHTTSPRLHNIVYKHLKLNAVFLAAPLTDIKDFIQTVKTFPIRLTAVTMPFKREIVHYLDHLSEEAKRVEVVNTIINDNGCLVGHNTDIGGIDYALRGNPIENKHVLIIGSGGAAQAAGYYFNSRRSRIFFLNRTYKNALELAERFGGEVVTPQQINDLPIDIIVNATPVGMLPNPNECPLSYFRFKPNHIVFDMVYNPVHTELLRRAEVKGAKTISGLDMFVWQGIRQIELWLDKTLATDHLLYKIKNQIIIMDKLTNGGRV